MERGMPHQRHDISEGAADATSLFVDTDRRDLAARRALPELGWPVTRPLHLVDKVGRDLTTKEVREELVELVVHPQHPGHADLNPFEMTERRISVVPPRI